MPEMDEIRQILQVLPQLNAATAIATQDYAKGDFYARLSTIQGKTPPRLLHPRVILYIGAQGFVDKQDAAQMKNFLRDQSDPDSAIAKMCGVIDADLRLYEMDLNQNAKDYRTESAMTAKECVQAIVYGMTAVENGIDIIALNVTGAGTKEVLQKMLSSHADEDVFDLITRMGGHDIAAATGTIIASRMGRVPVILDGEETALLAQLLRRASPQLSDHLLTASEIAPEKMADGPGLCGIAAIQNLQASA